MFGPNPAEAVTVDRLGKTVVIEFADEDAARACERTIRIGLAAIAALAQPLDDADNPR